MTTVPPLDLSILGRALAIGGVLLVTSVLSAPAQTGVHEWPVHSLDRPVPPVVTPGPAGDPVPPPSDAIVLFDGTDLSAWRGRNDTPAPWRVEDGAFVVTPRTGGIETAQAFGDVQLHIEWATPEAVSGEGQGRGNSGVFFGGGRYEVQVLDSYQNRTYADGQAAALYGQYPPLVNASRPPGQWQVYDIVFRGPRFDAQGNVTRTARITVFHNGVLVQDNSELTGPTVHTARPPYEAHPERLPISLQDHGNPVRFRNIWLRELQ